MTLRASKILLLAVVLFVAGQLAAYPLDGYEETGIRRVEWARMAHLGLAKGGFQPPGSPEPGGSWTWVSGEPWAWAVPAATCVRPTCLKTPER